MLLYCSQVALQTFAWNGLERFVGVYVVRCAHSTSGRGNFLARRILLRETSLKTRVHLLEEPLSILFCSSLSALPGRWRD